MSHEFTHDDLVDAVTRLTRYNGGLRALADLLQWIQDDASQDDTVQDALMVVIVASFGPQAGTVQRLLTDVMNTRLSSSPKPQFEWTAERIALLGTKPDRDVAAVLGLHEQTIFYQRSKRGIPAYGRRPVPFEWTEERVVKLGTMTDRALAEELGVSSTTVRKARTQRNIPPFGRGK